MKTQCDRNLTKMTSKRRHESSLQSIDAQGANVTQPRSVPSNHLLHQLIKVWLSFGLVSPTRTLFSINKRRPFLCVEREWSTFQTN